jgi:hypothetical protein
MTAVVRRPAPPAAVRPGEADTLEADGDGRDQNRDEPGSEVWFQMLSERP